MFKFLKYTLSALIIFLAACNSDKPTITLVHSFANDSWNAFNEVELDTTINDTKNPYQIILEVELTDKFESKDFSIGLTQSNEDGESRYSYHSLPIRNVKLKMIEKKNGDYYKYRLILNKKTFFNSISKYVWTMESVMGKVNIKGIHQLSLEIIQL